MTTFYTPRTRRRLRREVPSEVLTAFLATVPNPLRTDTETWRGGIDLPAEPEYPGAPATRTLEVTLTKQYGIGLGGARWNYQKHTWRWFGWRLAHVLGLLTTRAETEWLQLFARRPELQGLEWEVTDEGVIPRDYRGGMGRVRWNPELLPESERLPELLEALETRGLVLPPAPHRKFCTARGADLGAFESLEERPDTLAALVRYVALPPSTYLAAEALVTELRARLQPWWEEENGPPRRPTAEARVLWRVSEGPGAVTPYDLVGWPKTLQRTTTTGMSALEDYRSRRQQWSAAGRGEGRPNPYTPLVKILTWGIRVLRLEDACSVLYVPGLNARSG